MHVDLTKPLQSSFLSHGKDAETILRKLFIDDKKHSEELKRLLVINAEDCLSNKTDENYLNILKNMTLSKLMDLGYVSLIPKIRMPEHEEIKSYIILSFDNFFPNGTNAPEFRDCSISFDIICHTDYWKIGDYELRPLKIAGYIDGLLNETKLSGIGTLNFLGCKEIVLDNNLSGYTLMYSAVHGSDDKIPAKV